MNNTGKKSKIYHHLYLIQTQVCTQVQTLFEPGLRGMPYKVLFPKAGFLGMFLRLWNLKVSVNLKIVIEVIRPHSHLISCLCDCRNTVKKVLSYTAGLYHAFVSGA